MDVVDADGRTHTVEVGTWWWALSDPKHDSAPEAVCVLVDDRGVWVAGGPEWPVRFLAVVLLGPVVPYVSATAAPRSPRYDPRPGDSKTHPTGAPVVYVVGRNGDMLSVTDDHGWSDRWSLEDWSVPCVAPRGGDEMWECGPAWGLRRVPGAG